MGSTRSLNIWAAQKRYKTASSINGNRLHILPLMRLFCIAVLLILPAPLRAELDLDETIYRNRNLGIKLSILEG